MTPEKIKLIKEMARRGTKYEREIAREILKREGIDVSNLGPSESSTGTDAQHTESDEREYICFAYKSAFEKTIIFQTYFSIFEDDKTLSYIPDKKKVHIKIERRYATLMIEKTAALIDDYRKQLKLFNDAFIQKNRLFGKSDNVEDSTSSYTDREVDSIIELMKGISKTAIKRALKDAFK